MAKHLLLAASLVLPVLAVPVQAHAALVLVTSGSNDTAFENAGGFLQTYYGLPLTAGGTALPPLERAVAQVTGSRTSVNTGLYVPNSTTGIPFVGAGVTQALTNTTPVAGAASTPWVSNVAVSFTYSRTGNTVTFIQNGVTATDTQAFYASIDGLELRTRSMTPDATYTSTGISYSNLVYSDAVTSNQSLGTVSATNGAVAIRLYSGITGNFTLTGSATLAWAGPTNPVSPGNANLNAQLKLLDLPAPVPEPASVAMLGLAVLGLAALRRRG